MLLESLVRWDKLHATRRVLLIDTCHSGSDLSGGLRSDTRGIGLFEQDEVDTAVDATSGGLYILAASADDEFAREQEGNGLFTARFSRAWTGPPTRTGTATSRSRSSRTTPPSTSTAAAAAASAPRSPR